tara:strand:- start:972 stop:1433 length:462 start_codon:yes stop_codon:yes gene_type:complete
MSNWLFLMLLYGFFGWMKKRQKDKARDKIESQDDWDSGGIASFGEGILEAIIGDEENTVEKPIVVEEVGSYDKEYLDDTGETLDNSPEIEPKFSLKADEVLINDIPTEPIQNSKIYNRNTKLAKLIDLQDPIRTGVIFKEIFDKPKSLRGRKG